MSSGQFSSPRAMDSKVPSIIALLAGLSLCSLIFLVFLKTRAELEEIALAEADVARLKQKVAELHLQLSQQRQHQYGSFVDENDRYQHRPSHFPQ
jgi:hypothetical protein